MALTFNWAQSNGAPGGGGFGTVTDLGDTGNLADFKANDTTGISDYSSNPVVASDTAGQGYSMEVWLRLHFTGTGTSVSNIHFWKATDFTNNVGFTKPVDKYGVTTTYTTPTSSASAVAVTTTPTANPGSPNVSIAGDVNGTLSSFPAFSDLICLQVRLATTVEQGDSSLAVYAVEYDEN